MYSEFLNAQLWVEGSLFFSLFLCDLCLPFLLTTKGQKSFYWWWWCYFEVLCTVWEMKQKQNLVLIPILWSTFFFYCMCFCMERVTVEEEEEGGGEWCSDCNDWVGLDNYVINVVLVVGDAVGVVVDAVVVIVDVKWYSEVKSVNFSIFFCCRWWCWGWQ